MFLNISNLTLNNVQYFKKQVHQFYKSVDKNEKKYTMRIGIILYDSIHKNAIDTEKKLNAIKTIVELLNNKESHNENDLYFADKTLLDNDLCWIMGDL